MLYICSYISMLQVITGICTISTISKYLQLANELIDVYYEASKKVKALQTEAGFLECNNQLCYCYILDKWTMSISILYSVYVSA